jgi:hypothetical protein
MIRLRQADVAPVLPWPPSTGSADIPAAASLPMPATSFFMASHYNEIWDREFQSFLSGHSATSRETLKLAAMKAFVIR